MHASLHNRQSSEYPAQYFSEYPAQYFLEYPTQYFSEYPTQSFSEYPTQYWENTKSKGCMKIQTTLRAHTIKLTFRKKVLQFGQIFLTIIGTNTF